jgi:hypothetical protein
MSDGHQVCSLTDNIRRKSEKRAYSASFSEPSSSPVLWLDPEDASPLDAVASSPLASVASPLPVSPELVASPLDELSCPATARVPGRA